MTKQDYWIEESIVRRVRYWVIEQEEVGKPVWDQDDYITHKVWEDANKYGPFNLARAERCKQKFDSGLETIAKRVVEFQDYMNATRARLNKRGQLTSLGKNVANLTLEMPETKLRYIIKREDGETQTSNP